MRVGIFTDNDFGKVNGVTTTLKAVLAHAPSEFHLRVYTAADEGTDTPDYLAMKSIGVGIPFYAGMKMYMPRLRALVRQVRADGIDLLHLTTPGPLGLATLHVATQLHLPIVGSFHTDLAAYTRLLSGSSSLGSLMREYMRWPYGRCARVLVPSESTRRILIDAKLDAMKLEIWPHGVDTSIFSPTRRVEGMRTRWGVRDDELALIYVGRVSREKGLDRLPEISDRLRAAGVRHRLVIVGDGPMRRELAARLPDATFTGMLPHDDVSVAMASADLFVFPSQTDSAGNVVLEAQACGLPVIVSDQGGPQENMLAGATGVVCRGGTAEAFADGIAHLAQQPPVRSAFSRAAREFALQRQWGRTLQPVFRMYREFAGASGPRLPAVAVLGIPTHAAAR
jgi:glycosyltransferase involved in cell wall biosynthesis